jgi:hypothetical protein
VLADLCNVVNPEAIVVGGELSEAGEPLLSGIREAVDRYALPGAADVVEVVPGELGERAEILGAVALVTQSTETLRVIGTESVVSFGHASGPESAAWSSVGGKEGVHTG